MNYFDIETSHVVILLSDCSLDSSINRRAHAVAEDPNFKENSTWTRD